MNSSSWMPHGYCFRWDPVVLAMNVVGDGGLFVAFTLIAVGLVAVTLRFPRFKQFDLALMSFAAFIQLCGFIHLVSALTIWWPIYLVDAWLRLLTFFVAGVVAIALLRTLGTSSEP